MHITLAYFICVKFVDTYGCALYAVYFLVATLVLVFYHKNLAVFDPCSHSLLSTQRVGCLAQFIFHALHEEVWVNFFLAMQRLAMGLQIIYQKHGVIQNAFQMHTNSEENLMKDEAAMS